MAAADSLEDELKALRGRCERLTGCSVLTCVPAHVRVEVKLTQHRHVSVCLQFTDSYPQRPACVELKSKRLSEKVLAGLQKLADQEATRNVPRPHVFSVVQFVHHFLQENPLLVCNDEINRVKSELLTAEDEIRLKQKSSQVSVRAKEGDYHLFFRLSVPESYPLEATRVEISSTNFPDLLRKNLEGQATEIARQCVEPPLRRSPKAPPFEPKPAVWPVCEFLLARCVHRYPGEACVICKQPALPRRAQNMVLDPDSDRFVQRVYCGHLFHHGCILTYLKTPPFTGGKKCPDCGNQIFHDRYNCDPRLQESRWAHQEARNRELDEVIDFLN